MEREVWVLNPERPPERRSVGRGVERAMYCFERSRETNTASRFKDERRAQIFEEYSLFENSSMRVHRQKPQTRKIK